VSELRPKLQNDINNLYRNIVTLKAVEAFDIWESMKWCCGKRNIIGSIPQFIAIDGTDMEKVRENINAV